jgi:hypothetical protein
MILRISLVLATVFYVGANASEEQIIPLRIIGQCEYLVSTNSSQSRVTSQPFVLEQSGQNSFLFRAFFSRERANFVISLNRSGRRIQSASNGQPEQHIGDSYTLTVSRILNPSDRIKTILVHKEDAQSKIELSKVPEPQGTSSAWVEISANKDGSVSLSAIHDNKFIRSSERKLTVRLDYTLKFGMFDTQSVQFLLHLELPEGPNGTPQAAIEPVALAE